MAVIHEKIGELLGKAQQQMQAEAQLHGCDRLIAGMSTPDLETLMLMVHSHGNTNVSAYLDIRVKAELERRKANHETPESL